MFAGVRQWLSRRRAIVAFKRAHTPLPRFDPETGGRLYWRFDCTAVGSTYHLLTGEPVGGWRVRARAHRRRPGIGHGPRWRPLPSMWVLEQGDAEPRLVTPKPPRRPPAPPPRQPRRA